MPYLKEALKKQEIQFHKKLKTNNEILNPIHIVSFYNNNRRDQPLRFEGKFIQLLAEATIDDEYASIDFGDMYMFSTNDRRPEPDIIIDTHTREGRIELRRRLGLMAYLMKKQPKGEDGELPLDGGIVFGWVKLSDGSINHFYIAGFFMEEDPEWLCNAGELDKGHPYGARYLSREKEAFK